jgi:hypothetical protein
METGMLYEMANALASKRPSIDQPTSSRWFMLSQWKYDCRVVADTLGRNFPHFDPEKFLYLCGIEDSIP